MKLKTAIAAAVLMSSPLALGGEECSKIADDIEHYTKVSREGGSKRQQQVWRKLRIDAIGRYIYLQCRKEEGNGK